MEFDCRLKEFLHKITADLDSSFEFWWKHSHDSKNGGFYSCLGRDGKVYDTLKYGWVQGSQVWIYARLYNEVERFRKPEVLDVAEKGAEFIRNHLKDPATGRCYSIVTEDGKPVKLQRKIFTEVFYTIAMSELAIATKKTEYKEDALEMMKRIIRWFRTDDSDLGRPKLEGASKVNSLAVPLMLLSLVDQMVKMDPELQTVYQETSEWCIQQTLSHKQRGEKIILEHVCADGTELPGSQGRLTAPGHAIEASWFLIEHARGNPDRSYLIKEAIEKFLLPTFEWGWDKKYGGLFYFLDADGFPLTQPEWNMKLWWPISESLNAFLMAYQETGEDTLLEKFTTVFDYAYSHFVDGENGEWFSYLHQDGTISMNFKGGPMKGGFHILRCLLMCEKMLTEIIRKKETEKQ